MAGETETALTQPAFENVSDAVDAAKSIAAERMHIQYVALRHAGYTVLDGTRNMRPLGPHYRVWPGGRTEYHRHGRTPEY